MMCTYDTAFSPSLPSLNQPIKTAVCNHPGFVGLECISCGRYFDDDVFDAQLVSSYSSAVPLHYIYEGTRLSREEIARLKLEFTNMFLRQKKLFLVLDLGNTLLHSVSDQYMDWDESLRGEVFHVEALGLMTKLRPFVRTFLEEAETMFEMYIYTMGTRRYAKAMANLLDPEGVYFGSRVISREDCTREKQKGLDVVLAQEKAVLIIDDKQEVWPDHKENVIPVPKYEYFSCGDDECGDDEGESDAELSFLLEFLKEVHTKFFTEYNPKKLMAKDVREVFDMVGEECSI